MLSKSTSKLIKQIHQKKYRNRYNLFIVEGVKSVTEFLNSNFACKYLYAERDSVQEFFPSATEVSSQELKQISALKTPQKVLGVFERKQYPLPQKFEDWAFALDHIQDPGNMGTLIRLADWLGMKHLFCSTDCSDVYNPKVVQASMGSLTRVQVHYLSLFEFLSDFDGEIYGTFMNGKNIYRTHLASKAIIVMGNEANGISPEIEQFCTHCIAIPQIGNSTESLNVAMAAAMIGGEFLSRKF